MGALHATAGNGPRLDAPAGLDAAVAIARAEAASHPAATASQCAATAVLRVFGPELLDADGQIRPGCQAAYWRLVNRVEGRLGVHRRRAQNWSPMVPAMMAVRSGREGVGAIAAPAGRPQVVAA